MFPVMDGEKRRKVGSSFLSAWGAVPLAVVVVVQSHSCGSTGTILPKLLQIRLLPHISPFLSRMFYPARRRVGLSEAD